MLLLLLLSLLLLLLLLLLFLVVVVEVVFVKISHFFSFSRARTIFRKACEVSQWVRVRGQIERRWIEAVAENTLDDFAGNEGNLKLLCELRGVQFRHDNEHLVLEQLREKMVAEREKMQAASEGSEMDEDDGQARLAQCYERLVPPLMERLLFLLHRVVPSPSEGEDAKEIEERGTSKTKQEALSIECSELDSDSLASFEARAACLARWERKWRRRYGRCQVKSAAQLQAKLKRSAGMNRGTSGQLASLPPWAQTRLSAIASFALSPQQPQPTSASLSSSSGVLETESLLVRQQQRAVLRCKGYALLQQLLSHAAQRDCGMDVETLDIVEEEPASELGLEAAGWSGSSHDNGSASFEVVLQQVLVNNTRALFDSKHHLHQIGCARQEQKVRLQTLFASLFCRLSDILQSEVTIPTKQLALRVCSHPFRLGDVSLLEQSGILSILNALCAKDAISPRVTPMAEMAVDEDVDVIGAEGEKNAMEIDAKEGAKPASDAAIDSDLAAATFQAAAWHSFRHIALTCLALSRSLPNRLLGDAKEKVVAASTSAKNTTNSSSNNSNNSNSSQSLKAKPIHTAVASHSNRDCLNSLLSLIFNLLRKDIEALSRVLSPCQAKNNDNNNNDNDNATTSSSPVGAPYLLAENEHLYQLLSLLYLLSDNTLVRFLLSRPEHVRMLMDFLGVAVWPRTQRLVLRILRQLLPLQTQGDVMRECLAMLLTQLGRLQRFQQSPKAPALLKKKSSIAALLSPIPGKTATIPVPRHSEEPCYAVSLHEWALNEKKLLEVCQATLGSAFQPGATAATQPNVAGLGSSSSAPSATTDAMHAKMKAILQSLSDTGTALLTTLASKEQAARLAQALAAQGGGASVTVKRHEGEGAAGTCMDAATSRNEHSMWPLYWMDGQTAHALAAEYVELIRFLLRFALTQEQEAAERRREARKSEAQREAAMGEESQQQPAQKKQKTAVVSQPPDSQALPRTVKSTKKPVQPRESVARLWLRELAIALSGGCHDLATLLSDDSIRSKLLPVPDALSKALASLDVLGAFDEPLRPGATVVKCKRWFPMWHRFGTIKQYTLGAGKALVYFDDQSDNDAIERDGNEQPGGQAKARYAGEWVSCWKLHAVTEFVPVALLGADDDGDGNDVMDAPFNARDLLTAAVLTAVLDKPLGESLQSDGLIYKTLNCLLVRFFKLRISFFFSFFIFHFCFLSVRHFLTPRSSCARRLQPSVWRPCRDCWTRASWHACRASQRTRTCDTTSSWYEGRALLLIL
jgi:hypothetical protein